MLKRDLEIRLASFLLTISFAFRAKELPSLLDDMSLIKHDIAPSIDSLEPAGL